MSSRAGPRSRPWDRTILIGTAAVVLGMIALMAWTIWDARRVRWAHAIQTNENLVSTLGHDIQHNIEVYDLTLRAVIEGLQLPEIMNAPAALRNQALFAGAASAEDLGAIFVLNERGDLVLDSHSRVPSGENFADRDYFKVQRDSRGTGLYISTPYRSRIGGEWSIAISRRIEKPDGSFGGVAVGSLRLTFFKRLFDRVDLGAKGLVTLMRSDGRVVIRAPFEESFLNRDVSAGKLFEEFSQAPKGSLRALSMLDKVDRLFVFLHLGDLPLVLSVGTATDTVLEEWREKAYVTGGATLGLLGILAVLVVALRREFRHAQRSDALLREAIESISEGFVIYDTSDRLVICNEAYRTLYPKNAAYMVPGTRFEDIVRAGLLAGQTPDAVGREDEWLAQRMRMHRELVGPHEHRLWDGRWVMTSERRMPSGGIAGLRIDITALKAVQASLRQSRAELLRAQRVSNTGSVVRDFRSGKIEWSDETYRIFGVTRENFTPSTEAFLELVHPEDRNKLKVSIDANDEPSVTPSFEYRIIRPDGQTRWVYREAELVRDADGTPIGRVSTYKDITEQRLAKRRQEELETQLRHSQKLESLGTLAGGIAHDLNNTLVPILALSKMGMKRASPSSGEYRDLEVIARASEQARDLVKQILAFSRKDAAEKQQVDVARVVRDAMQMLHAGLPSTIRIVEHIEDVPPILADASQLHQIVTNLVTNAAQAIGDDFGTVTITVNRYVAPNLPAAVRLCVADTGCGMEQAIVERVFEPFFTTKAVGQGSGLGLAVVHGIVASHGGRIECRSKPGAGTEFTVLLPIPTGNMATAMDPAA